MKELRVPLPTFLAIITTVGLFGLIVLIVIRPVPEESRDIVYAAFGSIVTAWVMIISFHFGSSSAEVTRVHKQTEIAERESLHKMMNGHVKEGN